MSFFHHVLKLVLFIFENASYKKSFKDYVVNFLKLMKALFIRTSREYIMNVLVFPTRQFFPKIIFFLSTNFYTDILLKKNMYKCFFI